MLREALFVGLVTLTGCDAGSLEEPTCKYTPNRVFVQWGYFRWASRVSENGRIHYDYPSFVLIPNWVLYPAACCGMLISSI